MSNVSNTHHINNYYHFLIDILPYIIIDGKIATVPNSVKLPNFVYEYAEIFNIKISKFINKSAYELGSTKYNTPNVDSLKVLNKIKVSDNTVFSKRFYISRRLAKRRRIINENILNSLFKLYGIDVISLEEYSVIQQISLFNNAELIIAPHGAGLTNIVYCNNKPKIIEIKRNYNVFTVEEGIIDFINCYKDIAQKLELNYIEIFSDSLIANNNSVIHQDMLITDCLINVLKKEIQQVI